MQMRPIQKVARVVFRLLERSRVFAGKALVRCGLTMVPLTAVVALCFLMVSWRESKSSALAAAAEVRAETSAKAKWSARPPGTDSSLAAFERLRVRHASINVPD